MAIKLLGGKAALNRLAVCSRRTFDASDFKSLLASGLAVLSQVYDTITAVAAIALSSVS